VAIFSAISSTFFRLDLLWTVCCFVYADDDDDDDSSLKKNEGKRSSLVRGKISAN